ncbi:MAG TPA: hypothetical protein V6C50_04675 [Crinalium sp.]
MATISFDRFQTFFDQKGQRRTMSYSDTRYATDSGCPVGSDRSSHDSSWDGYNGSGGNYGSDSGGDDCS